MTWSPDSRFIAFGDGNEVRVYSVPDLELVRVCDGHTASVIAVAWSPDGKQLASSSADHTIRLWDAATGVAGPLLVGHRARVNAVAWRPDSQQLASGGRDDVVRLWSRDGSPVEILQGHTAEVHSVAWNDAGRKLATGSEDNTIRVWDVTSDPVRCAVIETGLRCRSIDWSGSDERLLVSHFHPTELRVWGLDGVPQLVLKHDDAAVTGEWSPDGLRIVSGSWDNTIRLWEADGTPGPVLTGHDGNVFSVKWSPDGRWIASGAGDHSVRLWHSDGRPGPVLQGPPYLCAASWSSDGRQFAVGGGDHSVRICAADGRQLRVLDGSPRPIVDLDWHPRHPRLVASYVTEEVRLWNIESGEDRVVVPANPKRVVRPTFVRWSPDGDRFAAAGGAVSTTRVFSAYGASLDELIGHRHVLYAVSWSPIDQRMATTSLDGTLRLWQPNGTLENTFNVGQLIASVAWRPDGRQIASGCEDGAIQLWEPSGRPGPLLRGHGDRVTSVEWSGDGRWIASGSRDNTARVWSADSKLLQVLQGHVGSVLKVDWRPQALQLLTVGEDGVVYLWDVATGRPLWMLIILGDGQIVRLNPDGGAISGDRSVIERELVYVVTEKDGSTRLLAPSEFASVFQKAD